MGGERGIGRRKGGIEGGGWGWEGKGRDRVGRQKITEHGKFFFHYVPMEKQGMVVCAGSLTIEVGSKVIFELKKIFVNFFLQGKG